LLLLEENLQHVSETVEENFAAFRAYIKEHAALYRASKENCVQNLCRWRDGKLMESFFRPR
jgi:hypothetical protein